MSDHGQAWTHAAPIMALINNAPMLQQQTSGGLLHQTLLRTYLLSRGGTGGVDMASWRAEHLNGGTLAVVLLIIAHVTAS
jgi:hypothetical protein